MGLRRRRGADERRSHVLGELGPATIGTAVVAVAAGGAVPDRPVTAPVGHWAQWVEVAEAHRLASMTLAAEQAGAVEVPAEVGPTLARLALDEATTSLAAERAALATIAELRARGCHPVLLKGVSIAERFYPRPSDRPTRDVDLLLPDQEVVMAWEVLQQAGYVVPLRGMDPAWVARYAKGRTLVGPDETEVDLHRTLTALPFGLAVDLEALWAEVGPGTVAGRPVDQLSAEGMFFHCCLHAALELVPVLLAHVDVVVMSHADLDLDRVRRLVGSGPLRSVVRAAVEEAGLLAPVAPAVVELARSLPPHPQGDRLLDWYRRRHRSFRASLVRAAPLVGGPAEQIKYGASVLAGVARMAIGGERP
jgi:hypothetical protein